jgi:FtsP/CotA-like multicopper oxidase with cupredoxin domain
VDDAVYAALAQPLTDVMRCTVLNLTASESAAAAGVVSPSAAAVDAVLAAAATDDDFVWNGSRLTPLPSVKFGPNRLVVLMSNTEGKATTEAVNGISGWGDVQIFEMGGTGTDWNLPFNIDLAGAVDPDAGSPSTTKGYSLARRSFFASETNADITSARQYPALHAPTITCKGGTYERWYVTNLGNIQPQVANGNLPDMHPFHIHLVSFVVTRRWELDANGVYQPAVALADDIDLVGRQDTVLVPSNQMVELLVYIPPHYTGKFAYHCHLLEHEDMCMMSHFEVVEPA